MRSKWYGIIDTHAFFLYLISSLQAGRVKAHELRSKSKDELVALLEDRKNELASLRVSKVTQGAAPRLSQMYVHPPFHPHLILCSVPGEESESGSDRDPSNAAPCRTSAL